MESPRFAGQLRLAVLLVPAAIVCSPKRESFAAAIRDPHLWSPTKPNLYVATIQLFRGEVPVDEMAIRFGMRKIEAKDQRILLNGKPIFLRGFGDDAIEPLTGFPPASKEVYRKRFETAKKYGFFFVRYHSWCPPPECFEAAAMSVVVLAGLWAMSVTNSKRFACLLVLVVGDMLGPITPTVTGVMFSKLSPSVFGSAVAIFFAIGLVGATSVPAGVGLASRQRPIQKALAFPMAAAILIGVFALLLNAL
jgi:hypothetical protein